MLSIGDFAKLGGASARMLRHYDALGLLVPTEVDSFTGRRHYQASQLTRLSRLLALKTLGFSLAEIADLLGDEVQSDGVERLLLRRQTELERQIADDQHLLRRVQARLRLIQEASVNTESTSVKVPELRLVGLSEEVRDATRQDLGRTVEQLFERVAHRMDAAAADRTSPFARYQVVDSGGWRVFAGYLMPAGSVAELEVETWPATEIVTVVHHGPMNELANAYQKLTQRLLEAGYCRNPSTGTWRESYLESAGEDQGDWIVEVQWEFPFPRESSE